MPLVKKKRDLSSYSRFSWQRPFRRHNHGSSGTLSPPNLFDLLDIRIYSCVTLLNNRI